MKTIAILRFEKDNKISATYRIDSIETEVLIYDMSGDDDAIYSESKRYWHDAFMRDPDKILESSSMDHPHDVSFNEAKLEKFNNTVIEINNRVNKQIELVQSGKVERMKLADFLETI